MQMLLLNLVVVAFGVWALSWLRREPGLARLLQLVLMAQGLTLALATIGLQALGWRSWAVVQLFAWVVFLHLPLQLAGAAWVSRAAAPRLARACGALSALIAVVGVDAFFIEPRWLDVETVTVVSEEVEAPLRVALIADLQTPTIGDYEAQALRRVFAEEPDLIVFTGDYIQVEPEDPAAEERAKLNALLRELPFEALPLGAFAVKGDVDRGPWAALFEGTGVRAVSRSETFDLGPLALTALSPEDSRSASPPVPPLDALHLVMGHSPDFAMAQPPADLLLAGHTHGGQVQLPFVGPLMTLSIVPRAWASGHTALPWGGDLVVSRGVGMERREAPQLRFLCRPQIVIVEIVPAGA